MTPGWFVRALSLQLLVLLPVEAMRPMVSYRALELGAGATALGIVAASYAALSFVVAIPLGRWVDRVGEPRLLLIGAGTVVASAGLLVAVESIAALAAAQALLGLGQVTSLVGLQTLAANRGDPAQRDARFGAATVVGSVGQMAGPAAAGGVYALGGGHLKVVFLAFGAVAVLAVLLAISLVLVPAPRVEAAVTSVPTTPSFTRSVGEVLRQPSVPHAMVASLAVLSTLDLLTAYLPAYGEANGISVETVGILLSIRAGASIVSRLLMMPMLRRLGRGRLLFWGIAVPAVALALLPSTADTWLLAGLLSVAGFGLGLGQPLSLSWIADQVPTHIRGTAIGIRLTGNRLGQLVVPVGAGAAAGVAGLGAVFFACSALLGAGAALVSRAGMGLSSASDPEG